MDENTKNPQMEELSPEQQSDISDLRHALDEAKDEIIRKVYRNISYQNMFHAVGQEDKYEDFKKYIDDYETTAKKVVSETPEGEEPKLDPPRQWSSFLDKDASVNAGDLSIVLDQIVQVCLNVSITAAIDIVGTIYDNVDGPQFEAVQNIHEQFAGAIGELVRRVEKLEKTATPESEDKPEPSK